MRSNVFVFDETTLAHSGVAAARWFSVFYSFRDLAAISGRENNSLYSQFSERLQKSLYANAQFIGEHNLAGHSATNRNGDNDGAYPSRWLK